MNEENKNIKSPREIFELAQTMFLNKDLSSFSNLFASDGILELPFHIQKSMRLIQGRENIRSYLATTGILLILSKCLIVFLSFVLFLHKIKSDY